MAERKRKASSDIIDKEFNQKRLHCDLKVKLCGLVDPKLTGYNQIIIRCGIYMDLVEVQRCKENGFTEICDILEQRGNFGVGNYDVLRQIFKDINEPAIEVIDKYQKEIDALKHEDKVSYKNQDVQTDEISSGVLKSWIEDDKTFCSTKATEYIFKQAEKHRKVLVSGVSGIGKSANVHHIALQLKDKGYRIFRVQRATKMIEKLGEDKQVYVFDDVFGVHGVVEEKRKSWSDENNKDDLERCLENPNVIILCTSRLQVILDDKLSSIKSHFTIINMSQGDTELTDDERVEIFRKHAIAKQRVDLLLKHKDHLTNKVEQEIRQVKCPLGCFPLVCRLFTGDKETKKTMDEYFSKPLRVIAKILDNLRIEEPIRHFCLLLCLIYDNKLPVNTIEVAYESEQDEQTKQLREELLLICELPSSTSLQTIKNKMDTLLPTFVKLEGGTYQFVHDIIHDTVIKHVSGLSSGLHKVIIRHCSSKFMMDRVHLSGVVCKDWLYPGHDTESCINIRPESFTCWGDRVLDIVRDGVRTSDQLYDDIDEGRCSIRDRRVWDDNPWWDVFIGNRCVHSTEGQAAIVQALKSSDVQTIMCTKGYSLSSRGPRVTGLHWAMRKGLTHIVTQTMSMLSPTQLREVDSIHDGGLLCRAISGRCDTDVIQALIDGGADVNTPDVYGLTPLYSAIREGCDTDVIQALIVGGADVNTPVLGSTPLCWAICGRCGTDVVQALIVDGADVNTPDVYGRTPLCLAIYRRYGTDVIQALIVGGVDVNTPDVEGRTPLYSAIDKGCGTDVIQALIVGGVDVNTPDVEGRTPLCWAIDKGCGTDVIQALIVGGADVNTHTTITDIPDSEVDHQWQRGRIQKLKEKENVTK